MSRAPRFNDDEARKIHKTYWSARKKGRPISMEALANDWGCKPPTIWAIVNRVGAYAVKR